MAKQTINIGAAPNDGTGTPLRTSFDYCNQNFTELYTATGPSGNNIVVPGSATITGDLTVDTSTLKVDSANNRVGVNTASPSTNLHVGSGTGLNNLGVGLSRGATTNFYEAYDGTKSFLAGTDASQTGVKVGSLTNHSMFLVCNNITQLQLDPLGVFTFTDGAGGTRMTLNSTGLGVGVASPSYKLDVNSGATASAANFKSTGSSVIARFADGTADTGYVGSGAALIAGGARTDFGILSVGSLILGANNARSVTVDTSGNVGVGVTPSAWGGAFKALQISRAGLRGSTATSGLSFNAYFDGTNFKYIAAGLNALDYFQNSGKHVWQIAGVAANANDPILFTEAMTLDASGNLILQSSATPATLTTNGQLTVNATSNTNLRFSYRGSDGVTRVANLTLA